MGQRQTQQERPSLTEVENEVPRGAETQAHAVSQWNLAPRFPARELFSMHQHHLQFLSSHPTRFAIFSTRRSGSPYNTCNLVTPRDFPFPGKLSPDPGMRGGPGALLRRGGLMRSCGDAASTHRVPGPVLPSRGFDSPHGPQKHVPD